MDAAPKPPVAGSRPTNINAIVGIALSSLSLAGWLLTLGVIFSTPKEQLTGEPQYDTLVSVNNGLMYLLQVAAGAAGLVCNGVFSLAGILVSVIGLNYEPKRPAWIGLWLGLASVMIAAAVILWRLWAWGAI
jgi:hypothetical protein